MPLPFTFPPLDFRALCAGLPPAPLARLAPTPSGFLHWGNAYSLGGKGVAGLPVFVAYLANTG